MQQVPYACYQHNEHYIYACLTMTLSRAYLMSAGLSDPPQHAHDKLIIDCVLHEWTFFVPAADACSLLDGFGDLL